MRKIHLLSCAILWMGSIPVFSQNVITGKVIDATGEPLIGVSIGVKGTALGVTTDQQGKYSISVPDKSILKFTYIGYEPQEINIKNQKAINVTFKTKTNY